MEAAHATDELYIDEGFIGTADWASPELLRSPLRGTPRPYSQMSDAYALATVLFECIGRQTLRSIYSKRHAGQRFCDFSAYVEKMGPPSLEPYAAMWGEELLHMIGDAWLADPQERCTAANLVDALETCTLRCGS